MVNCKISYDLTDNLAAESGLTNRLTKGIAGPADGPVDGPVVHLTDGLLTFIAVDEATQPINLR